MKKEHYTAITEFEVIAPRNDVEKVGDKITLSGNGYYLSEDNRRQYSLLSLIDHPLHFRVSKIIMQGVTFEIPADREQNYSPKFHPETMKYYLGKRDVKNQAEQRIFRSHPFDSWKEWSHL